ncbi:hypothetical protein, partial [Streptomyces xanthophaeus]
MRSGTKVLALGGAASGFTARKTAVRSLSAGYSESPEADAAELPPSSAGTPPESSLTALIDESAC